ncbi:MAG: CRTAC1 family protein [Acidobacteriota bacterium]|nr:MAG: CRTAC1 family protein [Acidobacteriota bacterium]
MKRRGWAVLVLWMVWSSCGSTASESDLPPSDGRDGETLAADQEVSEHLFTVMGDQIGLDFQHFNASSNERLLPETMGSGVAFFDFDNDLYPDLYLVNGAPLRGNADNSHTGRLYRNLGNGTFRDVTRGSGLEESFFGMGVAVGDMENDGLLDLAVSGVDSVRFYRNLGNGKFENVSQQVQIDCPGYGASLAFLDFDRDGWIDLLVTRYVEWTADTDIPCSPDGVHRTYCTPEVYPAISNCLFRNVDGKRFENVSKKAGLEELKGKALGAVTLDSNSDGWPDVAVANDTVGNFLLVNQGDGTFTDVGIDSGMAYSESGAARGGMGIDVGDVDGDGLVDIVIGNFSQEMSAFFRGVESGYFMDDAAQVGIGLPTLMTLAFGTLVEDFDNDGWLDILLVNGHIEPEIAATRPSQAYRQVPQFFRNVEGMKLEALDGNAAGLRDQLWVARGFASGDFDQDGDLDFVVTQNGGPAYLLRNNLKENNWLRIALTGTQSNRTGYGARVRIQIDSSRTLTRYLESGRSYLSASEPVITVGLGRAEAVERIEVQWPSGQLQEIESPPINSILRVTEPEGNAGKTR